MSIYTTEVRFICETEAGVAESKGFNDIEDIISKAIPKIFDFPFPIFDEDYKVPLERKILRHYYTREIGEETIGLWKLRLCSRLNEIMPYYNQLYKSETLTFNPLYDFEISKTANRGKNDSKSTNGSSNTSSTNNGTSNTTDNTTTSGTGTGTDYSLFSDTPQGALNGVDSERYLTTATKNTSNSNNSGSGTDTFNGTSTNNSTGESSYNDNESVSTTEDYTEKVLGKSSGQSYSRLLTEYRKTMLNIDMDIINNLSDLFIGLWG